MQVSFGFTFAKHCLSSNRCVSKHRWKLCILIIDYYKKLTNIPVLITPFLNVFRLLKNKRTKPLHRLIQTSNFTCAKLIPSFGAPEIVLVVPLPEFSIITKLNIDNLEVKNEKWIAATKSITDTE